MSGIQALAAYGLSDADSDEEHGLFDKSPEKESPKDNEKDIEMKQDAELNQKELEPNHSPDALSSPRELDETMNYNISDTEVDHTIEETENEIKGVEDMSTIKTEESEEENLEDDNNLDPSERLKRAAKRQKRISSENATALSKKIRSASIDEISIPPEPEGKCSQYLQDKIANLYEKKLRSGSDFNDVIQGRKDFRNPSIYDKLILYLGIEELGTNFSPEDYNPNEFKKYPAYDELARNQREDIAKREKEKKSSKTVEFVSAVKKSHHLDSRKSKWDQQGRASSVTGTSSTSTVIPALGSLKKSK